MPLTQLAFLDLGAPELLLILLIVLLLFGGRKLPELSKSLGSSLRELRSGLNNDETGKSDSKADKPKKEASNK
jgi:sec-independent protein translocase protein TatA